MTTLAGRVALVSGGGTGIGRGIARALVEAGVRVAIVGRRQEVVESTAAELSENGRVAALVGDVSDKEDCQRAVAETVDRFGTLGLLVNNAGVACPGPLEDVSEDGVHSMVDVDLKGPIFLTQAALPHLRAAAVAHGDASVLNISSSVTHHALPNYSVYSAAKAGLDMLTRCWARELGTDRIRVNAICPGIVETPVFEGMMPKDDIAAFLEGFNEIVPLGRVGQPADIAAMAVFLLRAESGWTTGAVVPVDGGLNLA